MGAPAKYWAFISYSHRDKVWGDWLHEALETFPVPAALVGRPSRNGPVPKRLFPVFRDREELPTAAELGKNIQDALASSRYLVVICSPHSAVSRWVDAEIRSFKAMGGEDRTLCIIVDGEPNASDRPDSGLLEAFPAPVRHRVGSDGSLLERAEPIAADARAGKDGKQNALLKLVAGLLGVGFDELKQRELERQRRQRRSFAAMGVALAALLVGIWGIQERSKLGAARRAVLSAYTEQGRRDSLNGDPYRAFASLSAAFVGGAEDPVTRFLLARAAEPEDALVAQIKTDGKEHAQLKAAHFSPDGRRYVAIQEDGDLWLGATATGERLATFKLGGENTKQVRFDPAGDRLLLIQEKAARVVSASSGAVIATLADSANLERARWSPDGSQIAANVVLRPTVVLYDAKSGARTGELAGRGHLEDIEFSPDNKHLVTADAESAKVWDRKTRQLLRSFDGQRAAGVVVGIQCVAVDPTGKRVLTGGSCGTAYLWDMATGAALHQFPVDPLLTVDEVGFTQGGQRLVTVSRKSTDRAVSSTGTLSLWDATDYKQVASFPARGPAVCSPDGRLVATHLGSYVESYLRIYDVESGLARSTEYMESLAGIEFTPDSSHLLVRMNLGHMLTIRKPKSGRFISAIRTSKGSVFSATFSPDGQQVSIVDLDARTQLFDLRTHRLVFKARGHAIGQRGAVFSPDGKQLVVAGTDGHVGLFDTGSGKRLKDWAGADALVQTASFTPDGKSLVVAPSDGPVQLLDATTGVSRTSFPQPPGLSTLSSALLSSTGDRLAACFENTDYLAPASPTKIKNLLRLWDTQTGKVIHEWGSAEVPWRVMAFSPDGHWLLKSSAAEGTTLCSTVDGALGTKLQEPTGRPQSAVISRNNRYLVTVSAEDHSIRLWDLPEGTPRHTLGAAEMEGGVACFSPDGTFVAAPTLSGAAMWDVESGRQVADFDLHAGRAVSVSFSPDGNCLATTGTDGRTIFWDVHCEQRPISAIEKLQLAGALWRQTPAGLEPVVPWAAAPRYSGKE